MRKHTTSPRLLAVVLLALASTTTLSAQGEHAPHIHTERDGAQLLRLPKQDDAFGFVVFGDRTGGPVEGIEVLKQAVRDTNLLDPDLVMTVGDLVNGYNDAARWRAQATEFKAAMEPLRMPWFPVAGNHDIYWRGDGKPAGEHEHDFETTFGPLWYAFEHKQCWFVVLYSDESDPATGKKDFNAPECQHISEVQFEWLRTTLARAKAARHVFVFLHHPRWITDRYTGADWERVHTLLAKNGNVRAVFAGHIHRMRFDGVRDGIQYFTVASVGAYLEMEAPQVGHLHEFHVVTVRPEGITVAALPVGTVMDPKAITGDISDDTDLVNQKLQAENVRGLAFRDDGSIDGLLQMDFANPGKRPLELTIVPGGDESWSFAPDHTHVVVAPGKRTEVTFAVRRAARSGPPSLPHFELHTDYLADGLRLALPTKRSDVAIPPPQFEPEVAATDGSLRLRGKESDCLQIDSDRLRLPEGPFTVEAWLRATTFAGRRAVLAKCEKSEFGLNCSDGRAAFLCHGSAGYATAETVDPVLQKNTWHHLAGVVDQTEVRLYVDGKLAAKAPYTGPRTTNELPLLVGADPTAAGNPMALFAGELDEVRISTGVRYTGDAFEPARRFEADESTALLLHLDADTGAWTADSGRHRAHALRRGNATCAAK